jgi:hypothetical protein
MAVYHVRNRLIGKLADFGLKPLCRLLVDGVGNYYTLAGDDKHVHVKFILKAVNVIGDTRDFTLDVLRERGTCPQSQYYQCHEQSFHCLFPPFGFIGCDISDPRFLI